MFKRNIYFTNIPCVNFFAGFYRGRYTSTTCIVFATLVLSWLYWRQKLLQILHSLIKNATNLKIRPFITIIRLKIDLISILFHD